MGKLRENLPSARPSILKIGQNMADILTSRRKNRVQASCGRLDGGRLGRAGRREAAPMPAPHRAAGWTAAGLGRGSACPTGQRPERQGGGLGESGCAGMASSKKGSAAQGSAQAAASARPGLPAAAGGPLAILSQRCRAAARPGLPATAAACRSHWRRSRVSFGSCSRLARLPRPVDRIGAAAGGMLSGPTQRHGSPCACGLPRRVPDKCDPPRTLRDNAAQSRPAAFPFFLQPPPKHACRAVPCAPLPLRCRQPPLAACDAIPMQLGMLHALRCEQEAAASSSRRALARAHDQCRRLFACRLFACRQAAGIVHCKWASGCAPSPAGHAVFACDVVGPYAARRRRFRFPFGRCLPCTIFARPTLSRPPPHYRDAFLVRTFSPPPACELPGGGFWDAVAGMHPEHARVVRLQARNKSSIPITAMRFRARCQAVRRPGCAETACGREDAPRADPHRAGERGREEKRHRRQARCKAPAAPGHPAWQAAGAGRCRARF